MLNFGNKEFRNLQEQVYKNKVDIEDILSAQVVLSQFGIKVVGHVDTEEELPDIETYTGEYGDAYAVGTETPYTYWIWSRPTADIPQAHWFRIGIFPQPGPQGIQGVQGPQGARGPQGISLVAEPANPTNVSQYEVGQTWLNTRSGDLFLLIAGDPENYWERQMNIVGPQGPQGNRGLQGIQGIQGLQGPVGPEGPAGKSLTVSGQVTSVGALPNPILMKPGTGYLVGTQAPYELYIIVGETQNTQQWLEVGIFNDFTYIELTLPINANQGTLSQEQYDELISSPYNTILVNGEYYRLNDDMTEDGYLVYTHTGATTEGQVIIKSLTITISTLGFVITQIAVSKKKYLNRLSLINPYPGVVWEGVGHMDIISYEPLAFPLENVLIWNLFKDTSLGTEIKPMSGMFYDPENNEEIYPMYIYPATRIGYFRLGAKIKNINTGQWRSGYSYDIYLNNAVSSIDTYEI